jgi:hypothetical protein
MERETLVSLLMLWANANSPEAFIMAPLADSKFRTKTAQSHFGSDRAMETEESTLEIGVFL